MLALRLTRGSRPAVQLRRLLVAAASAGTGFLLLCTLGYAMSHPPGDAALRLAWCVGPLAATVYLAAAVARTDPGTRPRPGLSALGLGPARVMAISATTTALSCTLGSMVALLFFLHLRGDLTGMPFDGAAAEFLAADRPLPLPAALTLLCLVPAAASVTVALLLRPRDDRAETVRRAARAYRWPATYGRFGANGSTTTAPGPAGARRGGANGSPGTVAVTGTTGATATAATAGATGPSGTTPLNGDGRIAVVAARPPEEPPGTTAPDGTATAPASAPGIPGSLLPDSRTAPAGLPWGVAVVAAGLAVEAYGSRTPDGGALDLPGGLGGGPVGVLAGLVLTATGLALAGPGLTHLCGRLLQAVRPGALRLLAGRVLMAEATRIGRPLGIVCAVLAAMYASTALHDARGPAAGPLTTLGALLVTGCTVATLLIAAVETRHARADTTEALLRIGAPATMLRGAALLRAGAVLALFGPLTLLVAELAALPLAR
ncbi:hypothetical protein [Streptomyces sp. DH24]|uniref:hypothetical protein n=1 Tax=Streptomyces sp. DH24 TaxID=3040123 RepID=UPI0024420E75|nr:hypothetical protein [Streptomyces sp. DH24]MDG9720960.1 hypothetical protein [Streptomyces sp. DH24]